MYQASDAEPSSMNSQHVTESSCVRIFDTVGTVSDAGSQGMFS